MKKIIQLTIAIAITIGFMACGTKTKKETTKTEKTAVESVAPEKPSDADLMAFKVYHHMVYMVTTAQEAGGTNKLFHTKALPTEGTDPVVTPALDHIYSKVVVDLTEGPVTVEYPKIDDRYYSIHITDQEHYTIFDEIHPKGKYTIVRKGKNMKAPEGATVIESPGDYPHLFIRVQVKTAEDMKNAWAIQEKIKLTSAGSKELVIENPIKHTIETHDVYQQNKEMLASKIDFTKDDYIRVSKYIGVVAPKFGVTGNIGMFGPIDSDEPNSNDAEYRAAAIVGHLGFPLHHAFYRPFFANCDGQVLNGDKTEVYTLPYKPEGCGLFWSVTRYSALTRNTLPGKNDLYNAYNTKPDDNGNITITFSVEDPNDGTYWMPVIKGDPYYFVIRYYKPDVNNLPKEPCS
jgi:hypothetical protein